MAAGACDLPSLLLASVQEVALEGLQGCSLSTLFSRLAQSEDVASVFKGKIDDGVKEWIWRELRERPEIEFIFQTGPLLPGQGADEKGKKGSRKSGASVGLAGSNAAKDKESVARGKRDFAFQPVPDRAILARPVHELMQQYEESLRMVATQPIRESALGVHDPEKPITDLQYTILEFIGRRRREGAMQMEVSKIFEIEPRNLFHHLRNLESANLIVRQQIILNRAQQPQSASGQGNFSSHTNLMHIKRFAPSGPVAGAPAQGASSRAGGAGGRKRKSNEEGEEEGEGGEEDEEGDSDEDEAQEGAFVLARDPEMCKEVCQLLGKTHNGLLIESDIKATLKLPGNKRKQARSWNRIKRKLIKMGLVEMTRFKLDGKKLVTCVKSLKQWSDDDMKRAQEAMDDDVEKLRAEIFVEQQVLDRIEEAGPDGTTHPDLYSDLGVDQKWLYEITKRLISNYGVLAIAEKTGRQSQYRLVAHRYYQDRAPAELQELVQRNMYQSWKKTRLTEELKKSGIELPGMAPSPPAAASVAMLTDPAAAGAMVPAEQQQAQQQQYGAPPEAMAYYDASLQQQHYQQQQQQQQAAYHEAQQHAAQHGEYGHHVAHQGHYAPQEAAQHAAHYAAQEAAQAQHGGHYAPPPAPAHYAAQGAVEHAGVHGHPEAAQQAGHYAPAPGADQPAPDSGGAQFFPTG
eukprot:tig00001428_g8722.t1